MILSPNVNTLNLFPTQAFVSSLELDQSHYSSILSDLDKRQKNGVHVPGGWYSNPAERRTDSIRTLSKIMGTQMYAIARDKFGAENKGFRKAEMPEYWAFGIRPGHLMEDQCMRRRWYLGFSFFNVGEGTSKLVIKSDNARMQGGMPKLDNTEYMYAPENNKAIFIPGYLPWKFTYNLSDQELQVVATSIVLS